MSRLPGIPTLIISCGFATAADPEKFWIREAPGVFGNPRSEKGRASPGEADTGGPGAEGTGVPRSAHVPDEILNPPRCPCASLKSRSLLGVHVRAKFLTPLSAHVLDKVLNAQGAHVSSKRVTPYPRRPYARGSFESP